MPDIHPLALFRLSVLGPLVSRGRLERGELKTIIHELAQRHYDIPGGRRSRIGEKTIESWDYRWRYHGVEALAPKVRADRGASKLAPPIQAAILAAKRDNPVAPSTRSANCSSTAARSPRGRCPAPPSTACCNITDCHG